MFLCKILKQIMHHFIEVLSVTFCILSYIGSSYKEETFDVTINPESCRPECDETRHKSESSPTTNPAHRLTRENTYKKNNTKRLLKQYSQSSRF